MVVQGHLLQQQKQPHSQWTLTCLLLALHLQQHLKMQQRQVRLLLLLLLEGRQMLAALQRLVQMAWMWMSSQHSLLLQLQSNLLQQVQSNQQQLLSLLQKLGLRLPRGQAHQQLQQRPSSRLSVTGSVSSSSRRMPA